jgi:hypothetical protein
MIQLVVYSAQHLRSHLDHHQSSKSLLHARMLGSHDQDTQLEKIFVFTYAKRGVKDYKYWKAERRASNGRMKQVHLGPSQGEKGLTEEALQKAPPC